MDFLLLSQCGETQVCRLGCIFSSHFLIIITILGMLSCFFQHSDNLETITCTSLFPNERTVSKHPLMLMIFFFCWAFKVPIDQLSLQLIAKTCNYTALFCTYRWWEKDFRFFSIYSFRDIHVLPMTPQRTHT